MGKEWREYQNKVFHEWMKLLSLPRRTAADMVRRERDEGIA